MSTLRYRYLAEPTGEQRRALNRLFGCTRLVYNQCVAAFRRDWRNGIRYRGLSTMQHEVLTRGKELRPFLRDVSGVPLIQAVRDADRAIRNMFDSRTGKRKGRRVGAPRFKSKHSRRGSARFTSASSAGGLRVREVPQTGWGEVFLPKIGWVRYRSSRPLPSQPSSVTAIHEPDGRIFLSFVVQEERAPEPTTTARASVVGVDLGLTDLAATVNTDGERAKIPAPKHLRRMERKLKTVQQEHARRQKGSKNRERSRKKIATLHRRVRETRRDAHHKLALQLVRENQTVVLETLTITALARTRLAKSIHDASWGMLVQLIEEKAATHGTRVVRVDRYYPSSKTCSQCGHINGELHLSQRAWECPQCHTNLDRDYNAAVNLVAAGLAETQNARGGEIRQLLAAALPSEAGTHRTRVPLRDAA